MCFPARTEVSIIAYSSSSHTFPFKEQLHEFFFFYSIAAENLSVVLRVSPCRLLYMLSTMVRRVRSAAIDARPTCVPTCSLLMEVVATSVVSATVSMKVRRNVQTTRIKLTLNSEYIIRTFIFSCFSFDLL